MGEGAHRSSCGIVKELANIILPLVGQSLSHIKNTQQFVNHIKSVQLFLGEVMVSYDVKALFTSVPIDPAIKIDQSRLQQDPLLPQRLSLSIPQIITLLEFPAQVSPQATYGPHTKQTTHRNTAILVPQQTVGTYC